MRKNCTCQVMDTLQMDKLLELAIEQGKIPRYLYKYTTSKNALRAIKDGSVYFACFSEFNDEYEGYAKLDPQNDVSDWLNFFVRNGVYGYDAFFLMQTVLKNPREVSEIIKNVIETGQQNNGFFCLSANPKNVLMWAHYADENKGCCLEYDLLADKEVFSKIKRIQYDDNTIVYNYLRNDKGAIDSMFHKSKQWEYEVEYRVVWIGEHGPRKVKEGCLTRVIMGTRVSPEDKREIINYAKLMKIAPVLCEAVKGEDPKEFDIRDM